MPALHARFFLVRRPALVAVAHARVAAQARAFGVVLAEEDQAMLELLVSELVTNAVLHARGLLMAVGVRLEAGRLRVEVDDGSADPPTGPGPRPPTGWEEESGRGLALIAALAAAHGWEPAPGGKRVWFELPVSGTTRARARAALLGRSGRSVRRSGGLNRQRPEPIPA